ncbi:MAG: Holliday junction resolvase RuvX [Chlamydiota bacterium]
MNAKGRIAGIDFGQKRIGIAVSDERQIFAQPLFCILAEKTVDATIKLIHVKLDIYQPLEKIVIGLPLHLNGKESPLSIEVRAFAQKLEEIFQIPIILWDERLTSCQVERTLKEAEFSRKKRSTLIDAMAAAAILQNFLDSSLRS